MDAMLSHLRFHRRGPSNPTSPVPDQLSPWDHAEHPQSIQDVSPRPDFRPRSSNSNNTPPTLPPIHRVTSNEAEPTSHHHHDRDPDPPAPQPVVSSPPTRPAYSGSGDSGFLGGVALQNYRRNMQATAENSGNPLPESHISRMKAPPPPINTNFPSRPPPVPIKQMKPASSSFITPTDLQYSNTTMGKRPAGTRLVSEPAMVATSQAMVDAQKAKKGLPFLKNPMSTLLMRRKGAQNSPDVLPLPFTQQTEEPTYDPRIRGTRVHDFSAPRPRRVISNDAGQQPLSPRPDGYGEFDKSPIPAPQREAPGLPLQMSRNARSSSGSSRLQPTNSDLEAQSDRQLSKMPSEQTLQDIRRASLDQKPLPEKPVSPTPEVPPKDDDSSSRAASTTSRVPSMAAASARVGSTASTRTTRARNISLTETIIRRESVMSSLPKHMKSTSSRFSFDMIGAAKAEKLLEERHRQKALEKQSSDPVSGQRDSRFDDFDDDFDYDAMMDDDGLEERIPGVNADYDEEEDFEVGLGDVELDNEAEDDPDNDQENFAGFVFQRSNPQSSVTSPHTPGMMATPRDANGNAVGFAMTKETTPDLHSATSPTYLLDPSDLSVQTKLQDTVAGLGIQGLDMSPSSVHEELEPAPLHVPRSSGVREDDLYFDEGLLEELAMAEDEVQPSTFDESIFDNNDTDQYGRPIPGAFAQAQAMRASQVQNQEKRVSDGTSRLSTQSGANQSTAHTSLSVGLQHFPSVIDKDRDAASPELEQPHPDPLPPTQISSADKVAAYQAALAEAAHKAAASGKFRRDSSPPPPAELTVTSPTTGSQPSTGDHMHRDPAFDDYDDYNDDDMDNGLDDYDFDDDAIIAEANASALANDSDGFYGQEFGFYSAPIQQSHHAHHNSNPSNTSSLSAQNLYEYSNGGFFGPSGVNRSTSGRVVSREPNLTPITERSEYSNRNSIMSLTLPPAIGSEGRNSASLQSPGLAQLAMMADDSDMSLSALLRLRNKAWGGSQASLVSSPRDQSPRSERAGLPGERGDGAASPWGIPGAGYLGVANHGRKNSAFSMWSNSDAGSGSGSPTMTMNMAFPGISAGSVAAGAGNSSSNNNNIMPSPIFSPPAPPAQQPSPVPQCPPVFEDEEIHEEVPSAVENSASSMSNSGVWMKSPSESSLHTNIISPISPSAASAAPNTRRPGMGHRHKGSADSISYVKEEDSGETRWVVERRRTAETGEVEILGREVVEGGRI